MVTPAGRYNSSPRTEVPEASIQSHRRASAIALSILAALASFLVLPLEGAIIASLGVVTLLSLCACIPIRPNPGLPDYSPWYERPAQIFPAITNFFRRPDPVGYVGNHPVATPGPRVRVQSRHFGVPHGTDPLSRAVHATVLPNREPSPPSNGPRAPVGAGNGTSRNVQ